ncbi:hypothetical protein STEG23_031669, partial [Scotinomys teguina]
MLSVLQRQQAAVGRGCPEKSKTSREEGKCEKQIQKNQGSLMPLQILQCIVDEDSPVLPHGEFSEPFIHFITQCMRKQPKERPAPEELM